MALLRPAHRVTTVVRSVVRETERISVFELADPDDWDLPPFTPGAHLDVHLPNGLVRTYSLCGSPTERNRYRIAVQREDAGRGGSRALHAMVAVGTGLSVSLPRNHFALASVPARHLLIAGGIGITPFVPMMAEIQRRGERCELHYCARSPQDAAFHRKLMESANAESVHMYYTRTGAPQRLDIASVLGRLNPDDHVYCCGPASMVNDLLERTADRDSSTVHVERFGAQGRRDTDPAFILELARSARKVQVETGESILEALRRAGVECDSSCEAGVCRSCSVRYLGGNPIHRDLVLSADERRTILLPCVAGCASNTLVLDL